MTESAPVQDAFRIACGTGFDRLPEIVCRAHTGKTRLEGKVRIQRGSWLASLAATALGLPAAGDSVAMTVESDHRPDCMIWNRSFGGRAFRSCFHLEQGGLTESIGPFRLHLRVVVEDGRLHYRLVRVGLRGIPWPRRLAPGLEAWEGAAGAQYDFAVEVRLPFLGRLVRYEGRLDHVA